MATDTPPIAEQGVATLPEQAWERARRRARSLGRWRSRRRSGMKRPIWQPGAGAVPAAGLRPDPPCPARFRAGHGSGCPASPVAKVKGRLPESVERVIRELLQKRFLTKQKRSLAAFHREVAQVQAAKAAGAGAQYRGLTDRRP